MPRQPTQHSPQGTSSTEDREDAGQPAGVETTAIATRTAAELNHHIGRAHRPGLHLVSTPIGNLGDITLRAIATLATADIVYAEDTRHTIKLLNHFSIHTPLKPYHEHNAERERPAILKALAEGKSLALVSDAGTPLVSDPGFKLVRDCLENGHSVDCLPGASAPLAALVTSGLPTDTFCFAGFLPSKTAARHTRILQLKDVPASLILFEAPSRLADALKALAETLGDRPAAVARELTKLNEELARGSLASLAEEFAARDQVKGELAIVIGPPLASSATDEDIGRALQTALDRMTLRDAAKNVAEHLNVSRKRVYDIGLAIKRAADPAGADRQ